MTLYTSDIEMKKNKAAKTAFLYLLVSLFWILFGAVYELFSHEVYSFFMIYAFVIPLVGGTVPFLTLSIVKAKKYPNAVCRNLYHAGIATLTVGSVLSGVLEIYGTTNALVDIYWFVGIPLTVVPVVIYILK